MSDSSESPTILAPASTASDSDCDSGTSASYPPQVDLHDILFEFEAQC